MDKFFHHRQRHSWLATILVPLLTLILACGPGAQPTPTTAAPTATSTKVPAATATVAAPTPTALPTPTPTSTGKVPKRGGTIIQYSSYPPQYDITRGSSPTQTYALTKLFMTTMYDDGPTNAKVFVCDLCEKWYLDNGGKTIVFQLRGDATFHDGKPITSRDMKYSLEKIMGKVDGIANIRAGFLRLYVDTIEAPDDRTMKVNMFSPAPVVPSIFTLGFSAILPEGTKAAELNSPPLGPNNKYTSGPFYLKEAVKDSHLIHERNPNYFKKDKNGVQLPYLDSIKMQVFADTTAAYTAFLTGKIDLFNNRNAAPDQFRPLLLKKVEAGEMGHLRQPFAATRTINLAQRDPLFKDIRVRQAINLIFDRKDFGDSLYGGEYVGATLMSFGTPWSRPEDKTWNVLPGWGTGAKKQQEVEQAKELLKQAGFVTGLNLPFLTTAAAPYGTEAIQRQMRNAGLNATLDVVDSTVHSQRQAAGQFVIHVYSQTLAVWDPDEIIGNAFVTGAEYNWQGVSDPRVDKQFVAMSSEQDPVKRRQLFFEIEDYLIAQVLYISAPDAYKDNYWISSLHGMDPGVGFLKVSHERGEAWWLDR